MPGLTIESHPSSKYSPRTRVNAQGADLTVAFAVDFQSAGERLTHRVAGERYVGIHLTSPGQDAVISARKLYAGLRQWKATRLNIAGNSIKTLQAAGWSQEAINEFVWCTLSTVHEHWPLQLVRSGGQTGADIAGAVAGVRLGVATLVYMPAGFRQRNVDGVDRNRTEQEIRDEVMNWSSSLVHPSRP